MLHPTTVSRSTKKLKIFVVLSGFLLLMGFSCFSTSAENRLENVTGFKTDEKSTKRKENHLALAYNLTMDSSAIVVTACVGSHEKLKSLSDANKRLYTSAHNFDFITASAELYPAMTFIQPYSWFKIALMLDVLKTARLAQTQHEWILWVDCDSLLSNLNENLVNLANKLIGENGKRQDEVDLIAAIDEGETEKINTGVLFVRNSQWSVDFLSTVIRKAEDKQLREQRHWEQGAINAMITGRNNEWNSKLLKVKRYQINSFQPEKDRIRNHKDNRFRKGETFVFHRVDCHGLQCDSVFEKLFCHLHSKDAVFEKRCHNVTIADLFEAS